MTALGSTLSATRAANPCTLLSATGVVISAIWIWRSLSMIRSTIRGIRERHGDKPKHSQFFLPPPRFEKDRKPNLINMAGVYALDRLLYKNVLRFLMTK